MKDLSIILRQVEVLRPQRSTSQTLRANRESQSAKQRVYFRYLVSMKVIRYIEAGRKVRQMVPSSPNSRKYLRMLCSSPLMERVTLTIPPMKMQKASILKPTMIQAGMVSNMWYLSCSPSAILLSTVMMMFTKPNMQASGTQRSKSIELLKVTVHPKASSSRTTMMAESATEWRSRNVKSKNWYSAPLTQAQIMKPMYLMRIETRPTHRLIFKVHLIQLSPSSSFSLQRYLSIQPPSTSSKGSNQPQVLSVEEWQLSLFCRLTQRSSFTSLPYPSPSSVLEQCLKTK